MDTRSRPVTGLFPRKCDWCVDSYNPGMPIYGIKPHLLMRNITTGEYAVVYTIGAPKIVGR